MVLFYAYRKICKFCTELDIICPYVHIIAYLFYKTLYLSYVSIGFIGGIRNVDFGEIPAQLPGKL